MKIGAIIDISILIFFCQLEESSSKHVRHGRHFIGAIYTKLDHALVGCNIRSLKTRGMIECAQKCLHTYNCGSYNFYITQGWCELKSLKEREPELQMNDFVFTQGCVFALLL